MDSRWQTRSVQPVITPISSVLIVLVVLVVFPRYPPRRANPLTVFDTRAKVVVAVFPSGRRTGRYGPISAHFDRQLKDFNEREIYSYACLS